MYIKLGKTSINYITPSSDDFMIFASVPSSHISTEKPTLIRGTEDLRLFFGRTFPEYNYYSELLEEGNTLLLMGPTSDQDNSDSIKIIGTENNYFLDKSGVRDFMIGNYVIKALPSRAIPGMIHRVISEDGNKIGGPIGRYNEFIYTTEGEWINLVDLPQYTWVNTKSQENKDSLRLTGNGFCHPDINPDENLLLPPKPYNSTYYSWNGTDWRECGEDSNPKYVFTRIKDLKDSIKKPKVGDVARIDEEVEVNYNRLEEEKDTLAFTWSGDTSWGEGDFIVLEDVLYGNPPKELLQFYTPIPISSTQDLLQLLKERGWTVAGNILYPPKPVPITEFYNHRSFKFVPSYSYTQKVLSSYNPGIVDFFSKTIGTEGPDSWIKISLENLEEEGTQRITISRFDYVEVFEGSWLKGTTEEMRLDLQINQYSKLVEAVYHEKGQVPQEGEWVLRGAESLQSLGKERSAEFLFSSEVPIDFFLCHDPAEYSLEFLLERAKEKNCQVLVHNTKENYKNNLKDTTNHLLYFYNPILLWGTLERPAWYLWLSGLLRDTYSETSEIISYVQPEEELGRVNYLVRSGKEFYYRNYYWTNDEQTGFMRFILGKIERELEKNKWNFSGDRPNGRTIKNIEDILEKIRTTFGIIRSLRIVDYNLIKNTIELTLETTISDLPDKDVVLDITLNYNNNNYE